MYQLGRSGSTVISRCVATMKGVALLSEVHPLATIELHTPIFQAREFFRIGTAKIATGPGAGGAPAGFAAQIAAIERECRARGLLLVIRDWTHMDFMGVPYTRPAYQMSTRRALAPLFRLVETATVRHPIDQWLSQENLPIMRGRMTLQEYLRGYRLFAEEAARTGFIRYEDFTRDPDAQLRTLCARLEIAFDPEYRQRWKQYRKITGDVIATRNQSDIQFSPRRPVRDGLLDEFAGNEDYTASLRLLGYGHPE